MTNFKIEDNHLSNCLRRASDKHFQPLSTVPQAVCCRLLVVLPWHFCISLELLHLIMFCLSEMHPSIYIVKLI